MARRFQARDHSALCRQAKASWADTGTDVERIYAEFAESLIAAYRTVPPVRGAEATMTQLRSLGCLIAITTGFDRVVTSSIFRRLGWESLFAALDLAKQLLKTLSV